MGLEYVIVNGRKRRLSDFAFKIAQKHFGATKDVPQKKEVPIELLKFSDVIVKAPEVIKAVKAEPLKEITEIPKQEEPVNAEQGRVIKRRNRKPKEK